MKNYILIDQSNFLDYLIRFETGNLSEYQILYYLHYLYVNDLHKKRRFKYQALIELINYGVLTKDKIHFNMLYDFHKSKRDDITKRTGFVFSDQKTNES